MRIIYKIISRIIVIIFLISNAAFGKIYFVDAISGNDINNGSSESSAFKSLPKVQSFQFKLVIASYLKEVRNGKAY